MSIKAEEKPLSKIFCSEYKFIIPSYQRPYSWGIEQAEKLFDDIYESFTDNKEKEFFLGSIVLIKKSDNKISEVIDGQQRLTTLTILWSSLCHAIEISSDKSQKAINYIKDIKGYLLEEGKISQNINPSYRVSLRERDRSIFKYVQDVKINDLLSKNENEISNEAQLNIQLNTKYLTNKATGLESSVYEFINYLTNKCYLVVVSTQDASSAMRIFSVMNNRGLDLKPSDIIKAEVLSELSMDDQTSLSEEWESYEEIVGREEFSQLFSHINMIYKKEKITSSLVDEFKLYVLKQFTDKKIFINEILKSYAENYTLINENKYISPNFQIEINNYISWLNRIPNKDWMPVALSFLKEFSNVGEGKIKNFFQNLERLASYLLMAGDNVNKRILRYRNVLEQIDTDSVDGTIQSLDLNMDEKRIFKESIEGDIYKYSPSVKRYLILRLDQFLSDGGAIYDPKILTIEHVLPQTVDLNSEWAVLWPDEDERKQWLHKLGNIVPLNKKSNSAAKNYEFERKKSAYFSGNNNISSYLLTTQVISESIWTPEVVERRQKSLIALLKNKWSL